jgi:hypothetical protein
MRTTTRVAMIAVAAAAALSMVPAAFGQFANNNTTVNATGNSTVGATGNTTGNTTGNSTVGAVTPVTPSTGPTAPLTAGTTTAPPVGGTGGVETAPLATTGGGDLAFAVGSLVAAGGLGLRLFATRRR